MIKSILLSGVGGQGILLAARIIASAAEVAGFDVATNEIHGMAQRGGSVTAQVRFGKGQFSPLALAGTVDVLISLEHTEALRCAHYLRKDGFAAVAKQSVIPVTVTTGESTYPTDVEERLRAVFANLLYADCEKLAEELGNRRTANVILTGMAARALPEIPDEAWAEALRRQVKPEFLEINKIAFDTGRRLS